MITPRRSDQRIYLYKKKPPDLLVNHDFQRSGLMLNNIIQELKSLLLVACLVVVL